jgi:ABC-type Mn2+/Zn2+ transport system ATPase subunit
MAISPQTLISAHDISLTRRGKIVLDKVSFELQQGEFLTIIGPNGAGKSSLIKVLLGLIKVVRVLVIRVVIHHLIGFLKANLVSF